MARRGRAIAGLSDYQALCKTLGHAAVYVRSRVHVCVSAVGRSVGPNQASDEVVDLPKLATTCVFTCHFLRGFEAFLLSLFRSRGSIILQCSSVAKLPNIQAVTSVLWKCLASIPTAKVTRSSSTFFLFGPAIFPTGLNAIPLAGLSLSGRPHRSQLGRCHHSAQMRYVREG